MPVCIASSLIISRTLLISLNLQQRGYNLINRKLSYFGRLAYDYQNRYMHKTSKSEVDKIKFARDAYTVGRHPSIKDGLGFKREVKNLTSHKASIRQGEREGPYG